MQYIIDLLLQNKLLMERSQKNPPKKILDLHSWFPADNGKGENTFKPQKQTHTHKKININCLLPRVLELGQRLK